MTILREALEKVAGGIFHIAAGGLAIWAGLKVIGEFAGKGTIKLKDFFGIKPKPEGVPVSLRRRIKRFFGIKQKPPTEKIRAALRKQWLEVGKDQQIPGVEYEGEVYYDTPH